MFIHRPAQAASVGVIVVVVVAGRERRCEVRRPNAVSCTRTSPAICERPRTNQSCVCGDVQAAISDQTNMYTLHIWYILCIRITFTDQQHTYFAVYPNIIYEYGAHILAVPLYKHTSGYIYL